MTVTSPPGVLVGERVRLRTMTTEDAPHIARWAADREFAENQWGRMRKQGVEAARDFIGWFAKEDSCLFAVELDDRVIGFANYRGLSRGDSTCEIGVGIGEKDLWSQGLGRDAVRALLRHLFEDLGIQRVTLHVIATNDRAIAAYRSCGFEFEGVEQRSRRAEDGSWHDMIRMAALRGRRRPSFDPRPVVLSGHHVRLEPLRMDHAAELFEAVKEPEIWTWLSAGPPASLEEMRAYVREALDLQIRGEHLPWLTRRAADGRAIGTTRYGAIDRGTRSVEIGWTMLTAEARRTPANTEAKYLQLRHAFEVLGAIRVWLKTDVLNERSRRAIERIGGKLDGIIRSERIVRDGRIRDACYYSFIDKEWPARKAHLEALLAR
ncbi:MAG: GNAT family N-acetyltransferase [Chloroflexi bacterium]|nr:GNAT family N-acetyltransferase [Chloroflexota bacterium]